MTPEEHAFMETWLGEIPADFEWPRWSVQLTQDKLRECLSAACHVARLGGARAACLQLHTNLVSDNFLDELAANIAARLEAK